MSNKTKLRTIDQINKNLEKIERFKNTESLPLSELKTNKNNKVKFIKHDFSWVKEVDYVKAVEIFSEGNVIIHSEDTLYSLDDTRNVWLRRKAMHRDNHTCVYCGGKGLATTYTDLYPIHGKELLENLMCCCSECKRLKGDKSHRFYQKLINTLGKEKMLEIEARRRIETKRRKRYLKYKRRRERKALLRGE